MGKIKVGVVSLMTISLLLSACGPRTDFTTQEFEDAVQNGEDVSGKTVLVEVNQVEEYPVFGYIIETGNHLHFSNSKNPEVEEGDTIIVEVEDYVIFLDEFIVTYKFVE